MPFRDWAAACACAACSIRLLERWAWALCASVLSHHSTPAIMLQAPALAAASSKCGMSLQLKLPLVLLEHTTACSAGFRSSASMLCGQARTTKQLQARHGGAQTHNG